MALARTRTALRVALVLVISIAVRAADEDPLQDLCVADLASTVKINGYLCKSNVSASDFYFTGLAEAGDSSNTSTGSKVTAGNVNTFPGLNTLGISMNRVDFAVGGVNPPHTHPRATEIIYLVKGVVVAGFATTDNKLYMQRMTPGGVFVVPRGLMHFQINVGKSTAWVITAFNSQLPGTVAFPSSLFATSPAIPSDVLTKSFQISNETLQEILSKFQS